MLTARAFLSRADDLPQITYKYNLHTIGTEAQSIKYYFSHMNCIFYVAC